MQEFEFVDNGVFEKDGVEYRNKGQVEIEDKLFYLFVTSDVPNFAPLYLKDTKKFVVLVVTDDKAREATEEERVILQCKCRRCINCGEVITKEDWFWVDGDTLCADCYENLLGEEIEICDICGCAHFFDNDRMIYIQEEEQLICDECAERHYFQCSNCGTWTRNPLQMTDGDYICNECFETGDYYICDDCGGVIDFDTESVIIRSDGVYCEDCASDETIEKAMLFISKHYEKVTIFADRLMCNICSYAGNNLEHYKDYYPNSKSVKEEINIVKRGKDNVRHKYLAINTLHKNTYEFRIFNSTVDKDRILAYIEFVDALLEYCSESNFLQIYKSDFLDLNKYAEGWGKYENLTHRFSVLNQEL